MAKIQFDDGTTVEFDGEPTADDIAHVESQIYGNKKKSLAEKTLSGLKEFSPFPESGKPLDVLSAPLNPLIGLEKYGGNIKAAGLAPIEKGMDAIASLPVKYGMPKTGAAAIVANELFAKPALRLATPFTPSEFGAAGTVMTAMEAPAVRKEIAPNLGKAYAENIVPSTTAEIRHSVRTGRKDVADLVIERPQLGSNRGEILKNSISGIEEKENAIQKVLEKSAKSGPAEIKVPRAKAGESEFEALKNKLQKPLELPSGKPIARYSEPKVGTIPGYEPEELNLTTKGKKFTKGESRGLFNQESPEIESKQIQYLKDQRQGDVLAAREAMRKRLSDPGYDIVPGKNAISRDDISDALDQTIKEAKKTGLEKESVKMLSELKDDFSQSHPQYADVQYWNDIKRALHRLTGNKGYLNQNPTAKVEALIALANRIKTKIENLVPGVKELNAEQGALLKIRDGIIQSSPKEVRNATLWGPIAERAGLMGARTLSRKAILPNPNFFRNLTPLTARRLPYDQDVK